MKRRNRTAFGAACAGLLLFAGLAGADTKPAPVPPGLEIEILDPRVDPVGNPAVLKCLGPDGLTRVGIPPTVLVHRYYYTGDRSFQGPLLTGGPCVLVVNHPKTGEQLYIPVQMLPGAPRVTYTDSSIEYDYHTQAITLTFCWLTGKPKIEYRQGVPLGQRVSKGIAAVGTAGQKCLDRTGLPEYAGKAADGVKNVAETTVDHVHDFTEIVVTPFIQAGQYLPGINWLTSSPEERAQHERDAVLRREQQKQQRNQTIFLPTNH